MEIGPVTSIRALPVVRPLPADPELSGVFDIENFARIGDETYSPSEGRSADDSDDAPEELDTEEELELKAQQSNGREEQQINFFA